MFNKMFLLTFSTMSLVGCSTHSIGPISAGENSYVISKQLASFASKEEEVLASLFEQANELCSNTNRYMQVEQLNEYVGLIGNDSKTTLVFSCLEEEVVSEKVEEVKASVPVKTAKPSTSSKPSSTETQTFPNKSKLTNFAF